MTITNTFFHKTAIRGDTEEWIKQLRIIDSTTEALFSNTIFKGVERHPKTGKKKGGIKDIVPCDA